MIYIGADHRGFRLKDEISKWLLGHHYEFRDLGANSYDKEDDYPDISIKLGETVAIEGARGILVCGSGAGASIAVNKVKASLPRTSPRARTKDPSSTGRPWLPGPAKSAARLWARRDSRRSKRCRATSSGPSRRGLSPVGPTKASSAGGTSPGGGGLQPFVVGVRAVGAAVHRQSVAES